MVLALELLSNNSDLLKKYIYSSTSASFYSSVGGLETLLVAGGLSIAPHHLWTKRALDILFASKLPISTIETIQDRTRKPLSLHSANRHQEASERFLISTIIRDSILLAYTSL